MSLSVVIFGLLQGESRDVFGTYCAVLLEIIVCVIVGRRKCGIEMSALLGEGGGGGGSFMIEPPIGDMRVAINDGHHI